MAESKADIRRRIRALRDAVPADLRAEWSARICAKAIALPAYRSARTIHLFLPFGSEVDTGAIARHALAGGKRVVVPVFARGSDETPCAQITSLEPDAFHCDQRGLRTPKALRLTPPDEIDLVFVPLVAFAHLALTPTGRGANRLTKIARVGYGVGFYDRFLKRIRDDAPKIGLAFALQQVEAIPVAPFDALLDEVITEADAPIPLL
ncbi:MAG: 5-formyltetrahydrofolate cyclo-ligase [Thermoflexales bacterium]|nr:5-formyltetrahydrofolate cyclo-ligase [Thermoflexales bacterium]MDW8351654.1 5-formyltetrahydrofolate cyclo-ligase [Anaerolineae bacterium]